MSFAPEFLLPDGSYSSNAYLSTTVDSRFIYGRLSSSQTVNVEVSIRGTAFTSDPDLVLFTEGGFQIPNPEAYPDGLALLSGANAVKVRAVGFGSAYEDATLVLSLVDETTVTFATNPPTNVRVESLKDHVEVTVDGVVGKASSVGYHFYASASAGGGQYGYTKVSNVPVTVPQVYRTATPFAEMSVDVPKQVDVNGFPLSDPMYAQFTMTQRGLTEKVFSTDINEVTEIPTTVSQLQVDMVISSYRESESFRFTHYRDGSGPNNKYVSSLASQPIDQPLYYVVTAVYYDESSRTEVESSFSPEVAATPITLTTVTANLPTPSRSELTKKAALAVHRTHPEVAIQPGSVIRDLVIDPFVTETMRMRVILDFLHRASSFSTLLVIDDPYGTGQSIDATQSAFKQRLAASLFLSKSTDVQSYIDGTFDKLASNVGLRRLSGTAARGEVTFYTKEAPSNSINIPLGTPVIGGGGTYRTTAAVSIPLSSLASYYNPSSREYSVRAGVRSVAVGSDGNVGAKQLTSTTITGMSVKNESACFGGTDQESNLTLSVRAQARLSSVDTGTERGYLQAAANLPGVEQVKVVSAGDSLMQRDYDEDYNKHIGGKVDVWIRGEQTSRVTDSFAFTFETARDIQFELTAHPDAYEFRASDLGLSTENPILEMLDYENPRLGFQNASTGEYFDLTDVEITSYNTIRLSIDVDQPSVDYGDVVLGDYRYRTGSNFILPTQPVRELTSLLGVSSGVISDSVYTLMRPNSPMTTGRSAQAGAYLKVEVPVDTTDLVVPSGALFEVTDEEHLLTGTYVEYLGSLGALPLTIRVTSPDGLTEYRGPYDPSGVFDYTIIDGSQIDPVGIQRVSGGDLVDGASVLVSYRHDENFTVTYESNLMVSSAQEEMDNLKHLTADVLCKETTEVLVNISATVITTNGGRASIADSAIRTSLNSLFLSLGLGDPVRQSDVIEALDRSEGVSYVVMPLVKMCLDDGAQIIRELVTADSLGDFERIGGWSTTSNNVYLLKNPLAHFTSAGGGVEYGNYVGVFQNDKEMTLSPVLPTLLGRTEYQAYIIGRDGMPIPGYSDMDTIRAMGYVTDDEISNQRMELTANRVLVSLPIGETPDESGWAVTYTTDGTNGVVDIEIGPSSYLRLGEVEFTFDEDRPSTRYQGTGALTSSGRSY
jgi:hypothetical protein